MNVQQVRMRSKFHVKPKNCNFENIFDTCATAELLKSAADVPLVTKDINNEYTG